ncbi:prepilin peptidase [Campylobacterota bacterium]|nr:prepilin peptidase [Campylobacterota bacterium]
MEYLAAIVFGLAFGSFGNVLILRLSKGENIAFPASHCPECGQNLRWFHNIPLLSYLFLRGKCAFCSGKISPIYPAIEAATALLFCAALYKTGANYYAVFAAITLFLLLCLSAIDLRTLTAPDSVNFAALFTALFASGAIAQNIQAALILAGALSLLRMALSSFLKKEAMGEADVILGATMGAFLGLLGAFLALFIAALLAIVPALINQKKGEAQTPFIPFLAAGTLIVFLFGQTLMQLLGWQ